MALVNALTTLNDVKTLAGIPLADTTQDARLEMIINAVSFQISSYCQRNFGLTTYTSENHAPSNRQLLILNNSPIQTITSIYYDTSLYVAGTDYTVIDEYSKSGMVYRQQGWTGKVLARQFLTDDPMAMARLLYVTYTAGYYLPGSVGYIAGVPNSLPYDLNYAVNLMAQNMYTSASRNNFDGLTGLSEGGLSYSWGAKPTNSAGIPDNIVGMLNKYKKIVVAA